MSNWRVEFSKEAEVDLHLIQKTWRRKILQRISWLTENFDAIIPLPLHGSWKGFFKLRVGDWRVVYVIEYNWQVILIRYIDRRDRIYKRL